jgi:hypothetical protein
MVARWPDELSGWVVEMGAVVNRQTDDRVRADGGDPLGNPAGDDEAADGSGAAETDGRTATGTGDPGDPGETGSADGSGGRSLGRLLAVVVLGLLLTATLLGANGVLLGQRTALSADYVSETMAEADVYGDVETTAEDLVADRAAGALGTSGAIPDAEGVVDGTIRELVTEAYVRDVVTTNLDGLYAYLHGDGPLELGVDTRPITSNISGVVERRIAEFPVPEVLGQASFGDAFSGFGVTPADVAEAYEDPERYRTLQSQVRAGLEAQGLDRDTVNQSVVQNTPLGDLPADVKQSVYDIETTAVLALTSDMSHEEFVRRMDARRDDFAAAVGGFAETRVTEQVEPTVDIDEQLGADARNQLESAANGVQLADTLMLALPLAALVLLVVVLVVSHSLGTTALTLGASLLAAGVLGFLARSVARGPVDSAVAEATADADRFVETTATALVDGVFGALGTQLLASVAAGVVLVAVGVALRRTGAAGDWS